MTELEKKKLLEQQGVPQMPTAAAPAQVGDYKPGQNVQDAYQQYLKQIQARPGAYNSQWQGQMDNLYNQISTRQPFKYDMNADLLYQQMKDQYARSGQLGMMNAMGQASALTGGYANSWAQTAGQQTYDQYMQELNNNLPALEDRAYGRYQDEGNQLAQRFGMAGQLNDRDYGMYRDQVGDWQYGTGMALDNYSNERNFDYGAYVDQTNWTREDKQRAEQWAREDAIRAQEQEAAQAAAQASGSSGGARRGGGTPPKDTGYNPNILTPPASGPWWTPAQMGNETLTGAPIHGPVNQALLPKNTGSTPTAAMTNTKVMSPEEFLKSKGFR